jgi:hypothetical protein
LGHRHAAVLRPDSASPIVSSGAHGETFFSRKERTRVEPLSNLNGTEGLS